MQALRFSTLRDSARSTALTAVGVALLAGSSESAERIPCYASSSRRDEDPRGLLTLRLPPWLLAASATCPSVFSHSSHARQGHTVGAAQAASCSGLPPLLASFVCEPLVCSARTLHSVHVSVRQADSFRQICAARSQIRIFVRLFEL